MSPVIRRETGTLAEKTEEIEEKHGRWISPGAETMETLGEWDELVAAIVDVPVKLTEAKIDSVEDQVKDADGAHGAVSPGAEPTGGAEPSADSSDHSADGGEPSADGADNHVAELNETKDHLDETKEHLEGIATDIEAGVGGALFVADINKMAQSVEEIIVAGNLLTGRDSLSKNLGAQKMESAATSRIRSRPAGSPALARRSTRVRSSISPTRKRRST